MHTPQRIHIGLALPSSSRLGGGVSVSAAGLANELSGRGFEVSVLSFIDEFSRADERDWPDGAICAQSSLSFNPSAILRLRNRMALSRANLFHVHGLWSPFSLVLGLNIFERRPYVVSPHGMLESWALQQRRWKKKLARYAFEQRNLNRSAVVHALTDSEAQDVARIAPGAPIAIIPNAIGAERRVTDSPAWVKHLPPSSKVLLFIGRIHPKKGLASFIPTFLKSRDQVATGSSSWHLVIAGPSELNHREELERLVSQSGGQSYVHFIGPVMGDAKAAALSSANAFVLPSYSEGLPMAVLEAWTYGLPVLMTSECNLSEAFSNHAAIELFRDSRQMATLTMFLEIDDVTRESLIVNGRKMVDTSFSWTGVGSKFEHLYMWIGGGGRRPDFVHV